MANENTRLQERIKQLEDAMGIANTLLQLVMCEQNHLREVRNKANDRIKRLEEAGDVLAQRSAQLGLLPMAIEGWNKAKEVKP
jgi:chromosome segregation ATPase